MLRREHHDSYHISRSQIRVHVTTSTYQNTHAYPFPSVLSVTQTEGYVFAYTLSTTLIHRTLEPPLGNNISSFRDHELREPLLVFNMPVASDAANMTPPNHEGFT